MGANRYTNEHKNTTRNEVDWDVEIYDDLGTPLGTFVISGNNACVFKEEGPSQDPLPGIYPTSLTMNFEVETAQMEFLVEDIRTLDRTRFAIKVYRDSNLIFVGRFSSHNITIENAAMPYSVQLSAQDGLANLKNDTYSSSISNGYSGQDTFLEHIKKCFDGMDIQDFYAGNFIDFTVNWYHSDMVNTTTNPLESARVDHITFQKDNGDFMTRWEVLKMICIGWGARLYYAEGGFHFEQISERSDASFQRFVYDTSFVETASSGLASIEQTLDISTGTSVTRGGKFGLLDNLKSVDVTLLLETGNLAAGLEWSYTDQNVKDLGTVKLESNDDFIRIKATLDSLTTTTLGQAFLTEQHRYEIKITIKQTNVTTAQVVYFERTVSYASFFNAVYSTVDSDPLNVAIHQTGDVHYINDTFGGKTITTQFIIGLPHLFSFGSTGDAFTFTMNVEISQIYGQTGNAISDPHVDYTFKWWLRNVFVELVSDTDSTQQAIEIHHIATNTLEAERKLELTSYFGDLANKRNGIQVYDGTNWNYSDKTWGVGTLTGTRAIALLLAREILSIRLTSRNLYHGGIITHEYRRDARMDYDGRDWIPLRGTYSSERDLFNGTLIEIEVQDLSGIGEDEVEVMETPPPVLTDNPNPDPPLTQTQNPSGLVTDQGLDNVSNYTVIDVVNNAGITLDSGEYVLVTNLSTGLSEVIQLTAALLSGSTTITIASYQFTNEYSIGSPIEIAPITEFEWIQDPNSPFIIDATDVSNGYITVTGPLSDPAAFADDSTYFRWAQIRRGSSELEFSSDAVANLDDDEYGIDQPNERVTFPDSWPLVAGEKIRVRYKVPRY